MPPAQTVEAAEVAVRGDPLAAGFDGERSEVGIRDEIALRAGVDAQSLEDLPVSRTRGQQNGIRLHSKRIGEGEGSLDRRGRREHARVGGDADEPAQNELG